MRGMAEKTSFAGFSPLISHNISAFHLPFIAPYRYHPGVVSLPSWRRIATFLAPYRYQLGVIPLPTRLRPSAFLFPCYNIIYGVRPFPLSAFLCLFFIPNSKFSSALCFSIQKTSKKVSRKFCVCRYKAYLCTRFRKGTLRFPWGPKKKVPGNLEDMPGSCYLCIRFPLSRGMHLVKDSSLKRFHKRSKQYKSRAFLARRIWQPSAARPLREACGGEPSKRERRPAQDRKDARPLRGLGSTIHYYNGEFDPGSG